MNKSGVATLANSERAAPVLKAMNENVHQAQKVHGDMPMRVMRNEDLYHIDGLAGLSNENEVIELEPKNLSWSGIWQADGQAAIGHATENIGLTVPFNTFNIGCRYKQGWRPKYVG